MEFRKATKADLETITRITVDCETDEENLQYPNKTLSEIRKYCTAESFRRALLRELKEKNMYFVVVEIDNNIIGFGQAILKKDVGEMGIGKELMKYLIRLLRKKKVKTIESHCYTKNKPALKMHEKLGFRKEAYKLSLEV
jgi:L-amino acid N-acyltransferase YncA